MLVRIIRYSLDGFILAQVRHPSNFSSLAVVTN